MAESLGRFIDNPFTVEELTPNTEYNVSVKVTDRIGKYTVSEPLDFKTLPPRPVFNTFYVENVEPYQQSVKITYGVDTEVGLARVRFYAINSETQETRQLGNNSTAQDNGDGTFSVSLRGLLPFTEYYIYAIAYDLNELETQSEDKWFQTYPRVPLLSNVSVVQQEQNIIKVNVQASSQLEAVGGMLRVFYTFNGYTDSHYLLNPITIGIFEPETYYDITFYVQDGYGQNSNEITINTFTYPYPPTIESTVVSEITQTTARVTCNATPTDMGGIGRYIYNYNGVTVSTTDNTYVMEGFFPYKNYTVKVDVEDIFRQQVEGEEIGFTTLPYPMVFNSLVLDYNTHDGGLFHIDVKNTLGLDINAPLEKIEFYNNNTLVFEYITSEFDFMVTGLIPGTDYSFTKAIVYDVAGQSASLDVSVNFQTIPSALSINNITISDITWGSALIQIDYECEAQIQYFEYANTIRATPLESDWKPVTNNIFLIENLTQLSLYRISVRISDVYNQTDTMMKQYSTPAQYFYVEFNTDGGSDIATQRIVKGRTINIDDFIPTKEGYNFIGWFIDDVQYSGVQTINDNIGFTAKWEEKTYIVNYYVDSNIIKTESVLYGGSGTYPSDPTKAGHIFIGWDKDVSFISSDLNVYAEFEVERFYLFFDTKGGESSINEKEVTYGEVVGNLPTPTFEDANFIQWNTEEDGSGETYTSNTIFNQENSITLHAIYDKYILQILRDTNGQSNYINDSMFENIEIFNTPMVLEYAGNRSVKGVFNATTNTGGNAQGILISTLNELPQGKYTLVFRYNFPLLNDNLSMFGGIILTSFNDSGRYIEFSPEDTSGVYIETFEVYYPSDGLFISLTSLDDGETLTNDVGFEFEINIYQNNDVLVALAPNTTIAPPTVTKLGYVFNGWYSDSEYTIPLPSDAKITKNFYQIYGKYDAEDLRVYLKTNGGSAIGEYLDGSYDRVLGNVPDPTKANSEFIGWYYNNIDYMPFVTNENLLTISKQTSNEIDIYARWSSTMYFSPENMRDFQVWALQAPVWYAYRAEEIGLSYNYSGNSIISYPIIEPYFIYSPALLMPNMFVPLRTYKFEMKTNATEGQSTCYIYSKDGFGEASITASRPSTSSNYDTWTVPEGSLSDITDVFMTFPNYIDEQESRIIDFYISFTDHKFTIELWDVNEDMSDDVLFKTINVDYSSNPNGITLPTLSRVGYVFKGWKSQYTYKTYISHLPFEFMDDVLNVQWEQIKGDVTFTAFYPTGGAANQTITVGYGNDIVPPLNITTYFNGYTFLGWFDGNGNKLEVGEAVYSSLTGEPLKYTAKWELTEYTITYVLNGGTMTGVYPTTYNINSPSKTFNFDDFTKDNHKFFSFYTTSDFSDGTAVHAHMGGITGNKTYYARWNLIMDDWQLSSGSYDAYIDKFDELTWSVDVRESPYNSLGNNKNLYAQNYLDPSINFTAGTYKLTTVIRWSMLDALNLKESGGVTIRWLSSNGVDYTTVLATEDKETITTSKDRTTSYTFTVTQEQLDNFMDISVPANNKRQVSLGVYENATTFSQDGTMEVYFCLTKID